MALFQYEGPRSTNAFAQGAELGLRSAIAEKNQQNEDRRYQLLSDEMAMRVEENARKIGKEEAKARIDMMGNAAMAAQLAEQEGGDPAKAYTAARAAAVSQYPELDSTMPKGYDKEGIYALLGQSAEAMDIVTRMSNNKADRQFRKEMFDLEKADKAEYRNFMREERAAAREDRALDRASNRELADIRLQAAKERAAGYGGVGAKTSASAINNAIKVRQSMLEDMDETDPDYAATRAELDDLLQAQYQLSTGREAPAAPSAKPQMPSAQRVRQNGVVYVRQPDGSYLPE